MDSIGSLSLDANQRVAREVRRPAPRARQPWTLRLRVATVSGVLTALLVAAVTAGAIAFTLGNAARQAEATVREAAHQFAGRLDLELGRRGREVRTMAEFGPLWSGDAASLRALLDQFRAGFPHYAWIGFAGRDGVVQAATGGEQEHRALAGLTALREAHGAPVLLAAGHDERPGLIAFAAPVRDARGMTLGMLVAHLSQGWADELRGGLTGIPIAGDASRTAPIEITVMTADGQTVLGPQGRLPSQHEVRATAVSPMGTGFGHAGTNGPTFVTAVASTAGQRRLDETRGGEGWLVVAAGPTGAVDALMHPIVLEILLTGVGAGGIGLLLSFLLAARIADPFTRLCAAADQLGAIDAAHRLASEADEATRLAVALRTLADRHAAAQRQLKAESERAETASARLSEEIAGLKRLAACDPMTGALNRRGFLSAVAEAREGMVPHRTMGVLVVDIDHFKRVNDAFGHAAGDLVIRRVADTIRATVRQSDIVARFGGEEFVVVTSSATEEELGALAERLRAAVEAVPAVEGESPRVTVSIGGAVDEARGHDVEALIDRADIALYAAKDGGRNCVRMAPPADPARGAGHAAPRATVARMDVAGRG
jgi:diguanylate cyclase (GGDEF)-like protein